MTLEQRLKEIETRLERATPRPWEPCGARFSIVSSYLNPQEHLDICDTAIADLMSNDQATHNAYLIAHAPSDLAFLSKALKVACEALEDCTGGDLASGEGIYKAHVAQGALAEIERLAKGTPDER